MRTQCDIKNVIITFMQLSLPSKKGKGSPYSITEHRFTELIPVLGS